MNPEPSMFQRLSPEPPSSSEDRASPLVCLPSEQQATFILHFGGPLDPRVGSLVFPYELSLGRRGSRLRFRGETYWISDEGKLQLCHRPGFTAVACRGQMEVAEGVEGSAEREPWGGPPSQPVRVRVTRPSDVAPERAAEAAGLLAELRSELTAVAECLQARRVRGFGLRWYASWTVEALDATSRGLGVGMPNEGIAGPLAQVRASDWVAAALVRLGVGDAAPWVRIVPPTAP